ncbi:MAG TPA: serine/threonine-protein kinase, partial [Pirellulales bacterium]
MSKLPKGEPTRDAGTDATRNAAAQSPSPPVIASSQEPASPSEPIEKTIFLPRTALPTAESATPLDYSPTAPTLPVSEVPTSPDSRAVKQGSATYGSSEKQEAEAGGRFRPLRPWREGGLGKVSIALDEELHREVALKEIKSRHATNKQSQDRFLLEAEITGSLEHPGIVPVYGMGRYHDGRPYYAMRFVHGDSLEEAIHRYHRASERGAQDPSERAVEFRELLTRFIAVCNAIAYAHSRGVLHRDLKPGNILLAKYGETLVVDWGLAKVAGQTDQIALTSGEMPLELPSGSQSAPTRLGSVIGTPGYMSPEQADGRLDLLGPPTDIYSLGATLYCVLAGVSPFTDSALDALLDKVKRGEFPPPRSVDSQIPRPLEAICLKAMSRRRDDRYATASALADDLAHWLADEPVSAYPERPLQRAARWVRRHRDAAMITAIGVALLAIVSVVAAVLVNHQRMIAAKLADDNFHLAEQERLAKNQAEIAFREARDAVDDLFTKVSEDSLLNQPGMQGVRKDLLQKTLDYY